MYEKPKTTKPRSWRLLRGIALVLAPLLVAGLYMLVNQIHGLFRYDRSYFSPEYQDVYYSPGAVALELEQVLRTGDAELYAELTGLRSSLVPSDRNPNIALVSLTEVDSRDYFHYLYVDTNGTLRETHYIKKVSGRWVVSPEDMFFHFDSGRWIGVFIPIAVVWWIILMIVALGVFISRSSTQARGTLYG